MKKTRSQKSRDTVPLRDLLGFNVHYSIDLKVPKREIFVTELCTLSDPIWIGDLRTEAKNPFV